MGTNRRKPSTSPPPVPQPEATERKEEFTMKYPHPWRRLGALACTAALTLTLIPAASASGGG